MGFVKKERKKEFRIRIMVHVGGWGHAENNSEFCRRGWGQIIQIQNFGGKQFRICGELGGGGWVFRSLGSQGR